MRDAAFLCRPAERRRPWLAWLLALAFSSAASAGGYEESTPFVGVRHFHRTLYLPRLLDVNVVEIDPTIPGVDFLVTPSNGSAPGETVAQTTRAFAAQHGAQVAVNANFFAYVSGVNMNNLGLSASRGDAYSPFEANFLTALNVTAGNVAAIIQSTEGSGTAHSPPMRLHNAVGGNERILSQGNITAGDGSIHPRTAAGVTAEGKLILMTVDGLNPGHSLGVTTPELASLMLSYGAVDAINLDGGGSTTMVFADPTPRVVNVPVGVNNVPGSERSNGNNFGVFANSYVAPTNNRFVFSDFEMNDPGHFGQSLLASGSTDGVLAGSTTVTNGGRPGSRGAQRIAVRDDPNVSGGTENPNGWFVRHLAGSPGAAAPGSRAANHVRPAVGIIGLWAMASAPGIEVAIAIDDSNDVTADRTVKQAIIPDGQWHRYAWDLQNPADWEPWAFGDGVIDSPDFTLDSIQLFGPNANVSLMIDDVFHETLPNAAPMPGDFDFNGQVDQIDLGLWRRSYGATSSAAADADGDRDIDGADFLAWQRNVTPSSAAVQIPEPSAAVLVLTLLAARRTYRYPRVLAATR